MKSGKEETNLSQNVGIESSKFSFDFSFFEKKKRGSSTTKSVVVLMDARQGCWRLLRASTEQVQITLANHLAAVWALKPEPFWEKQHVECVKSRQDCKVRYCCRLSSFMSFNRFDF